MMGSQAIFWGLVICAGFGLVYGAFDGSPFFWPLAAVGLLVGSYGIWVVVRYVNHRDDPSRSGRPPEAP